VYGTAGGFLDNCTQNVSVLLDHLAKRLSAEDGMAEAVHCAKFIYARVAEPPKIDEWPNDVTSLWQRSATEAHACRAVCTTSWLLKIVASQRFSYALSPS
jgi:hypothetical protein